MSGLLAYAEQADTSDRNVMMMFWGLLILAGVAAAGFVVVYLAKKRGRSTELIFTGVFFWGLIAAGSCLYALESQMNWSKEYLVRIESGYVDPKDLSDAPKLPWGIWGGLGVMYVGMLGWVIWKKSGPSGPPLNGVSGNP